MSLDPYAACSCGSGKKFRWCCEPIFKDLQRAYEQEQNGQVEAAGRILDDIVAAHPTNPEAWGRKAEFLYRHEKPDEAETALQKAFAIAPNYPFGLSLQAIFRFTEGEFQGALLLARRAAEAYDPAARDALSQIYGLITDCELRMQRPVAARAALQRVVRFNPADAQAREQFEVMFGEQSRLPAAARRDYVLLSPDSFRRAAWDQAYSGVNKERFGELARAYDRLAAEDPKDASAAFNLGLTRAWLGDNAAALDALDRYLDLDIDDAQATEAATLQEVLRCGRGLEERSDYREYVFALQFRDAPAVQNLLNEWANSRRLVPLQAPEEGMFVALLLEMSTTGLVTVGSPAADAGRFAAYLLIAGNLLQVTSPVKKAFDRLRDEVRQKLALGLTDLPERTGPVQFQDVVADALIFPITGGEQQIKEKVAAHQQRYFEETWIHKPRRVLAGVAPVDAVGHRTLRKKLLGVVQFIQDCARTGLVSAYDFDRLRRKLGLFGAAPAAATAAVGESAKLDIAAMSAAELAALPLESLSTPQVEQAWQAAQKLDAQELALNFAKALTARPPVPDKTDRYHVYAYLTQRALLDGDPAAALGFVDAGEQADRADNEGRRANDYELRRGQVLVKRGDADAAATVFQRLIDAAPTNLKYRGAAAEAMLSLKQGRRALDFAEAGLAAARQQHDRDSEGYLAELAAAGRKQIG
jgi:tetratricopeptide (TPR) repeat protein